MTRLEVIGELVRQDADRLQAVSSTPQLDCQILLGSALGQARSWLIAHADEHPDATGLCQYRAMLARRLAGEPVAYITASKGFWQREFYVNPSTLIPRPETELLLEILLNQYDNTPLSVLDLGTGTGAIAISLAAERPAWQVTAVDICNDALEVAKRNAGPLRNVRFVQSDWFADITGVFDVIVSNPPYLREGDTHLQMLRHEPKLALIAGEDGLACLRQIASRASDYLAADGMLLLEHGYDQNAAVARLLSGLGYREIQSFRDLQALPRAVSALRPEPGS